MEDDQRRRLDQLRHIDIEDPDSKDRGAGRRSLSAFLRPSVNGQAPKGEETDKSDNGDEIAQPTHDTLLPVKMTRPAIRDQKTASSRTV